MTNKKKQNSLIFEINQDVADALGISKKSDIEMILVDDTLIIKSKKKSVAAKKKLESKRNAITKKLMNEYESVLKKLAKT